MGNRKVFPPPWPLDEGDAPTETLQQLLLLLGEKPLQEHELDEEEEKPLQEHELDKEAALLTEKV